MSSLTTQEKSPIQWKNYLILIICLGVGALINAFSPAIMAKIEHTSDSSMAKVFLVLTTIFACGYAANRLTQRQIIIQSFAMIGFGLVLKDIISPAQGIMLQASAPLVNLILYLGGIEVDPKDFRKIMLPTISLAVFGYLITVIVFGFTMSTLTSGFGIDPTGWYLLGAILGSTDPAALLPVLKGLGFKTPDLKNIAIAESAINDVIGTVVVALMSQSLIKGIEIHNISDFLGMIASKEAGIHLSIEIGIGIFFGIVSFFILKQYEKRKGSKDYEESSIDFGFKLFIPCFAFLMSFMFHGSGYLAAFIAGAMSSYNSHLFKVTGHLLETKIDVIAKPFIFMMLGTVVNFSDLGTYFLPGLVATAVFVIISRPIAVFGSIVPLRVFGVKYTTKELGFLCIIRETGVIPAVLLAGIPILLPQFKPLLAIGVWIILHTLLWLPMATKWWAKKMGIMNE